MATKKELEAENAVSDFNASSIPLTKSGKIGQSGIRYIKSMYSSGVSLKRLEEAVADCSFTPSGQKAWKTFLAVEGKAVVEDDLISERKSCRNSEVGLIVQ